MPDRTHPNAAEYSRQLSVMETKTRKLRKLYRKGVLMKAEVTAQRIEELRKLPLIYERYHKLCCVLQDRLDLIVVKDSTVYTIV